MRPSHRPDHAGIQRPLDILWQGRTIVWMILAGEGLAVVLALATDTTRSPLVYFGLASLAVQWVIFLGLAGLYLMRRWLQAARAMSVAYVAMGLLLLSTWLVGLLIVWLFGPSLLADSGNRLSLLLRLSGIALVVGLLGLAAFYNHWRASQLVVQAKQAELEALKARVRPHFLFNTLNTGAALVHARPDEAERVLLDLADLFRAALSGPELVQLSKELELTRHYLEIEALRFGPRLQVRWHLPGIIPDIAVPALSLQPLAENAIRHGIERLPKGGSIDIRLECDRDWVLVRLENDVPGDDACAAEGHGIGLNSARERIRAASAGRGDVETRLQDGRHMTTVRLPA